MLLKRESDVVWTTEEVARRLYIDPTAANAAMEPLVRRGLVQKSGVVGAFVYAYGPPSEEMRTTIDQLEELYSKLLIPITNLLHNKASSAVHQFANAFKLRDRR